jgi:hypothetical protein
MRLSCPAVFVLGLVLLLAGGCENFMADNSENPFKESIEEAVWEATAPRFEVRVQAGPDTGTTTPVGSVEVKQRVPFHVLFTPAADYFFIRWAAYDASSMAEYGADIVIFTAPGALETDVTIDASEGNFLIQPVCVKRPTVSSKRPGADATNVMINQPLSVTFDSDVAPESFVFPDGSLRTGDADRDFNNISIIGKRQSDETQSSYAKYFKDWEYKNRTLLIRVDGELPLMADVSVVLNKNIYMNYVENGINYQVPMAGNYAWSFSMGTTKDTEPPFVEGIVFGTSEGDPAPKLVNQGNTAGSSSGPGYDLTQPGAISERRFNTDVIYVAFRAYDSMDGDNIPEISIKARHYEDINGNPTGYEAPDVPNPSANNTSSLADTVRFLDSTTGTLSAAKNDAVVYVVPYNISNLGDGVIEFAITLTDQQQNTTNTPDHPPYRYYIVRDRTPPYSDPANITVETDSNTGWINGAHPNIRFARNGDYNIVDPGAKGASGIQTWSASVQWAFGFSNTVQPASWVSVPTGPVTPAETITITADGSTPDGVVPIYLWLRDDLNAAVYPFATPIQKDTVIPVFDSLAVTGLDRNSAVTPDQPLPGLDASITYNPTVTYSAAVRDPGDTATASKLAAYHVEKRDKGGPVPGNPDGLDPSVWTNFAGTAELTNVINVPPGPTITLDASKGDGIHEVWFWVKDTAGNVSNPAVRKVVLDTTSPALNKFYLKKGLFDSLSGASPADPTPPADSYPGTVGVYYNGIYWNFAFEANDATTGVKEFQYSIDGSNWLPSAGWLPAAAQDVTGNYLVPGQSVYRDGVLRAQGVLNQHSSLSEGSLKDSPNTIMIRVRDYLGNESAPFAAGNTGNVVYDSTVPSVSDVKINSGYNGTTAFGGTDSEGRVRTYYSPDSGTTIYTNTKSLQFGGTASDPGAKVSGYRRLSITSGNMTVPPVSDNLATRGVSTPQAISSQVDFNWTGDGVKTITYKAEDWAGNIDTMGKSVQVTLDQTPPVISAINRVQDDTDKHVYTFTVTATDALSGLKSARLAIYGPSAGLIDQNTFSRHNSETAVVETDTGILSEYPSNALVLNKPYTGGSVTFKVVLNAYGSALDGDDLFGNSGKALSGLYPVKAEVWDNLDNKVSALNTPNASDLHDTRAPVLQSMGSFAGGDPKYFTVMNSTSNGTSTTEAYSRKDGTGYRKFFINTTHYYVKIKPNDKKPDTNGSGIKSAAMLVYIPLTDNTDKYWAVTTNLSADETEALLQWGNETLTFGSDSKSHRINLFVQDLKGNYAFYPRTPTPTGTPPIEITGSTGVSNGDPAYFDSTNTKDFRVYLDNRGPELTSNSTYNDTSLSMGTDTPERQPRWTGSGYAVGTGNGVIVRNPVITFEVQDLSTSTNTVEDLSGLENWGYAFASTNTGIGRDPLNEVYEAVKTEIGEGNIKWKGSETGFESLDASPGAVKFVSYSFTDFPNTSSWTMGTPLFPADDSQAAAAGYRRLYIFFKDKAGNIVSADYNNGSTSGTAAHFIHLPQAYYGGTGESRNWFVQDKDAPMLGSFKIKNNVASVPDGMEEVVINADGSNAPGFGLYMSNVKELGSGIKTIHLRSTVQLAVEGTQLKVNGTSAEVTYANVSTVPSGGYYTMDIVFTNPRRLDTGALNVEAYDGSNYIGLDNNNTSSWDGRIVDMEAYLEDASGNKSGQADYTAENPSFVWKAASNRLIVDRTESTELPNVRAYGPEAPGTLDGNRSNNALGGKKEGDGVGVYGNSGQAAAMTTSNYSTAAEVFYTFKYKEYGAGIKAIKFDTGNFETVTKVRYFYEGTATDASDLSNIAGISPSNTNYTDLAGGGGFSWSASTQIITFNGTTPGVTNGYLNDGYPRVKRTNSTLPNPQSIVVYGTVAGEGVKTIKLVEISDRVGKNCGFGDDSNVPRTIVYDRTPPVLGTGRFTSLGGTMLSYTGIDGTAYLELPFTELHSGIHELTFDTSYFGNTAAGDIVYGSGTVLSSKFKLEGNSKVTFDVPADLKSDNSNHGGTVRLKLTFLSGTEGLPDGEYTVKITGISDKAGNTGTNPSGYVQVLITKDTARPALSASPVIQGALASEAGATNSQFGNTLTVKSDHNDVAAYAITASGVGTAPASGWEPMTGGMATGSPGNWSWTFTNVTLPDTSGNFEIWLQDKVGNVSEDVNTNTYVGSYLFDGTAPSISASSITGNGAPVSGFVTQASGNTVAFSTGDTDVVKYIFTETGVATAPAGGWVDLAAGSSWSITSGALPGFPSLSGAGSFKIWIRDKAGNASAAATVTYTYNGTPPVIGTVTVTGKNAGAEAGYISSVDGNTITVTGTAADFYGFAITGTNGTAPGSAGFKSTGVTGTGSPWTWNTLTDAVTLPDTSGGAKLWLMDKYGRTTGLNFTYTRLTSVPGGVTVIGQGGDALVTGNPAYTNATSVTYTLTVSETNTASLLAKYGISNAAETVPAAFTSLTWSGTTASITDTHGLTAGIAGTRYIWFQDKAGNINNAGSPNVDITVHYDTTAPVPSGLTIRGLGAADGYTTDAAAANSTISITAADIDIKRFALTAAATAPAANADDWKPYSSGSTEFNLGLTLTPNSANSFNLYLQDTAGNVTPYANRLSYTLTHDNTAPVMNMGTLSFSGKTISGFTMTDTNLNTVEIYKANSGQAEGSPLNNVAIDPDYGTIDFSTYSFDSGSITRFYVKGIDRAGNTNSLTFTVSVDTSSNIATVTSKLTLFAGFIDGVSEFTGNTVRRVRSGLSAVAATFSGSSRRSASTTAEPASQPRQRIGYQSSRERAEAARSPAVVSTLNSRRAATGDSSAGADPAPRETARANRAPEREGNGVGQSENVLAEDGETAGESLEAVSFRSNGGPAALTADQDAGMKGAAFFFAVFALLTAAAVFLMVRMRLRKSKDDTEGRV